MTKDTLIARCEANSLRMTKQSCVIAKAFQDCADQPDAKKLYGRARYEDAGHDHLINIQTGEIIEFADKETEDLQKTAKLGYDLRGHRLERYSVPKKKD